MATLLMVAASAGVAGAQSVDLESLPLVTDLPDGVKADSYSKNDHYFGVSMWGEFFQSQELGMVGMVALDGGKAYFYEPFSGLPTGSYLVGDVDGDKITVSFPQKMQVETYPDYNLDPEGNVLVTNNFYAFKCRLSDDGETSRLEMDNADPTVTFTIAADGSISLDGDAYIALIFSEKDENGADTFEWTGYADSEIVYNVVTETPTAMPAGASPEVWVMDCGGEVRLVKGVMQGDDLYLQGVLESMPQGVVKGSRDSATGRYLFQTQYVGIDERNSHYAYFVPATYTMEENEFEELEPAYTPASAVEISYDESARTLTTGEGEALVFGTQPAGGFVLYGYTEPTFRWQDMSTPMVPANPVITDYTYYDYLEFGGLFFTLPRVAADGRVLNPADYYYNIYLDDEPLVLYPDEYYEIEEPMENIPCEFENFSEITYYGEDYEFVIYARGFSRIGVQGVYVNPDGTQTKSDLVYHEVSSLQSVEDAGVVSTEWFDISGRRISASATGLAICRQTMDDGTVRTLKVLKK